MVHFGARKTCVDGIKAGDAVSGLQKYIRRGEVEKAMEMALILIKTGFPGAVFNRLLIIASEDISLGNPFALGVVIRGWEFFIKLLMKHQRCCKSKVKLGPAKDCPEAVKLILGIVKFLAESSSKTRICANAISCALINSTGKVSKTDCDEVFFDKWFRTLDINLRENLKILKKTNPLTRGYRNLRYALVRFLYLIQQVTTEYYNKSAPSSDWDELEREIVDLATLIYIWNDLLAEKKSKHVIVNFIFNALMVVAKKHVKMLPALMSSDASHNVIKDAKAAYKKDKNNLHFMFAVLFVARILRFKLIPDYMSDDDHIFEEITDEDLESLKEMISSGVELDDYVCDKHTVRGRRKKRGIEHFFEEGAKLKFDGPVPHNPYEAEHKRLYLEIESLHGTRKTKFQKIKARKAHVFTEGIGYSLPKRKRRRDKSSDTFELASDKKKIRLG